VTNVGRDDNRPCRRHGIGAPEGKRRTGDGFDEPPNGIGNANKPENVTAAAGCAVRVPYERNNYPSGDIRSPSFAFYERVSDTVRARTSNVNFAT